MYEVAIRRLRKYDRPEIVTHFNNLDEDSLISRFGAPIHPQRLQTYIDGMLGTAALVFGAFPDSQLRGVGELRPVPDSKTSVAEAALSVERPWQDKGIGDAILSRMITVARNRGIREIHMLCLTTNQKMRYLASKHKAELELLSGQIEASLTTPWPTPLTMAEEIAGEYHAIARAILSWPKQVQSAD